MKRHLLGSAILIAMVVASLGGGAGAAAAADAGDIVIVGGTAVVSDGIAEHLGSCTTGTVDRIAGTDRYATAAQIASSFASPNIVFLATGHDYPDAIAAGSVAALTSAPILLTHRDSIPAVTNSALDSISPDTVVILGGHAVVDATVEAQLASRFPSVVRLAGANRFATAAAVSRWHFTDPAVVDTVYVATGRNYLDALVAGPAATADGAPVLLVERSGVPSATMNEIVRLSPSRIVIVGSVGVVDSDVEDTLASTGVSIQRIAGSSRYSTAQAAAAGASPGVRVYLVTGENFPDGLAAIPLANGDPIVLAGADDLPAATAAAIGTRTGTGCESWAPPYPDVGEGKRVIYTLSGHQLWMIDENENLVDTYPVTGRVGIPHPGTYSVFSKSVNAWAPYGGITMKHMVRFVRPHTWGNQWSYGFHSIPRYADGRALMREDELGSYGSGGCVRQADHKAEAMYAWADIGTTVIVLP